MRMMAVTTLLLLAGCGGGGGSDPVVVPSNQAPQFTSAATASLVENAALSYQATASDPDGDALTFSIAGGPDAARFSITPTGLLNFVEAPDADRPADADADNVYQVTLSVSDGRTTASLPVEITVTNSREGIAVRRVFSGFNLPEAMTSIPGDSRLFVVERQGKIYYFDPATGTRTFFSSIPSPSHPDVSILGLVASPNYATDGQLYISYRVDRKFIVRVIDRAKVEAGGTDYSTVVATFDTLTVFPPSHAGWLGFGSDGLLYFATGSTYEEGFTDAHDDGNYVGKLIRITPDTGATPPYSYEVVAKGFFSPASAIFIDNRLLVGDQGSRLASEIDLVDINGPLLSFGYPYREGTVKTHPGRPLPTEPAGLVAPLLETPDTLQNGSLILGPIYDGPVSSLRGQLIFSTLSLSGAPPGGTSSIWTIDANQLLSATTTLPLEAAAKRDQDFAPDAGTINGIRNFTMTADGRLFILDRDGEIFEVVADS